MAMLETADAVDIDGTRLLDGDGRGVVKVCEDEDPDDQDAKNELLELRASMRNTSHETSSAPSAGPGNPRKLEEEPQATDYDDRSSTVTISGERVSRSNQCAEQGLRTQQLIASNTAGEASVAFHPSTVCSMCLFHQLQPLSVTCGICTNVLNRERCPIADPARVRRAEQLVPEFRGTAESVGVLWTTAQRLRRYLCFSPYEIVAPCHPST